MDKKETPKKSGLVTGILIGLLILLLAGIVFQFFWNKTKQQEKDDTIVAQTETITEQKTTLDNTIAKMDSIQFKLEEVRAEKEALGQDVSELTYQIETLTADKKRFKANYMNPSVKREMNAKIANYEEMLRQQSDQIRDLKARNDSLFKENVVLKEDISALNDTVAELVQLTDDQEDELEKGRKLKASDFTISAIKNPEKGRKKTNTEQVYRDRDMVQTEINFVLGSNPIALIEEKSVYVQIIGPNGDVIHDMAQGSGKFMTGEKEMIYSIKQNVQYNRNMKELVLNFEKPADYQPGTHTIKVFCDEQLIGATEFTIK